MGTFKKNQIVEDIKSVEKNIDSTLLNAVDGFQGGIASNTPAIHTSASKEGFTSKETRQQFESLLQEPSTELQEFRETKALIDQNFEQNFKPDFSYQAEQEKIDREIKQVKDHLKAQVGNTLYDPEELEGFDQGVKVQPRRKITEGMTTESVSAPKVLDNGAIPPPNRAATKVDLSKLTEADIMNLPFIEATTDIVPSIMSLKPIDPLIRFRWVNFKDSSGGNMHKYQALGFTQATPDDVDQKVTPICESCIQGTQIKYIDVMLMKINVVKLMSRYKANILEATGRLKNYQESGRSAAQTAFDNLIYNGVSDANINKGESLRNVMRRMKQAGHNIEFFIPGFEESVSMQNGPSDEAFMSGRAFSGNQ